MSKLSLKLQAKSLKEMSDRKIYLKNLAGFKYLVLPKVYKGSTDTELFCKLIKLKKHQDVWDIGTGTGLIALAAKLKGAKYVLATDLNPPFTDNKTEKEFDISFWDKDHKTVRKFFKDLKIHLKPKGKAFIAWSSFGDTQKLKKIAKEFNFSLKEVGKKKGKRNFVYYIFEVIY